MVKIGILGAGGRMGQALVQACNLAAETQLSAAFDHAESSALGKDAGLFSGLEENGVMITADIAKQLAMVDVVIDFSRPDGTLALLDACVENNVAAVIGTTGFDDAQKARIEAISQKIPLMMAANMSVGVNLCLKLLETISKTMGADADIEIIEAHHRHKVDAPSGTALRMGEVIADALDISLKEHAIYGREGHTGERTPQTIGFSTIRAGDIVGEHTALFAFEGERIELTHKASSRMTFANGAVRAALWLNNKKPGLYDMPDVLGF